MWGSGLHGLVDNHTKEDFEAVEEEEKIKHGDKKKKKRI